MSASLPLFDQVFSGPPAPVRKPLTGRELRDSGIDSAYQHVLKVKAKYVDDCLAKIAALPSGSMFTSEDVRQMAGDPPLGCENSIAGILKRAAGKNHNLIVITKETRQGKRASLHAKDLSLWRRL
jgi:hypothetical protein